MAKCGDKRMKINQCQTKGEIAQWVEEKIKKIDEQILNAIKLAHNQRDTIIWKASEQMKKITGETKQ
jgi:hypothetical protein